MMLHAVEAPLLKMVAVAGAAVMAGVLIAPEREDKVVQRLELHAPKRCNEIYLTKWRRGDVYVTLRTATPSPMTFQTRARIFDGCEWMGIETLTPDGPNRYFYRYDEQILSCAPGAKPTKKTPRTGYVLVVDQHEQ